MKRSFAVVALLSILIACGDSAHDEAKDLARQIKESAKKNSPGTVSTSENGYNMRAMIDGKLWIASHMMPDKDSSSSYLRIHGENGGDYINFQVWKQGITPGKKFPFDEDHAANLSLEADAGFWGGRSGQLEITKLDGEWMEGKFSFKATSSSSPKSIEVSEGFFRVPFLLDQ